MDPGDVVTPAAYILFYSAIEGQTSLPPLGQFRFFTSPSLIFLRNPISAAQSNL